MDNVKKYSFFICSIASLLLGAALFIYFFGYKIINPLYIDWIFYSHPDLQETFLGWNYFQHSPWNFPIGAYDALSYPIETSILNTDSIPLFAIFFKLFKNILPDDFQYWGIYVLLCYMLQSFFGMTIVRKFCKNDFLGNLIAILSGLFFVLMPSLTLKAFWHTTSVYHFLILACFVPVIYKFNLKINIIYFGIVGFLTGSIQPYIVAIDWIIILFYCLYLYIDKKDFKQFLPLISYTAVAIFILYIIGGFLGTSEFAEKDLIENSFNLNGFFNSMGFMKCFNLPYYNLCQSQGYAYFGLGSTIIILVSLVHFLIMCLKNKFLHNYKKEFLFIFILIITSIILALSPRITYGNLILFEIPYPPFIVKLWSIFRCTGRFILISNYIILTISMCYISKHFSRKILTFLLILALGIQLYDFAPLCRWKNFTKDYFIYNNNTYAELIDAIKENDIKYIYFDKEIYKNADTILYSSILMNIVAQSRNRYIKFNSFYFAREIKGLDESFLVGLCKLKNIIFISSTNKINCRMIYNNQFKYYYLYQKLIIESAIEIKHLTNYIVNKESLLDNRKRLKNTNILTFYNDLFNNIEYRNMNKIINPTFYSLHVIGRFYEKKFYLQYF